MPSFLFQKFCKSTKPEPTSQRKLMVSNKNEHKLSSKSCDFNGKTLLQLPVHLSTQHNGKPSLICVHFTKYFTTESDFKKHLKEQHTLGISSQKDKKDDQSFRSASNNTFEIIKIEAEKNHDLVDFLLEKETLSQETLMENSQQKPVKVQISVKLNLQKPIEEDSETR